MEEHKEASKEECKKADALEQLEKIRNSLEASPEEQIKNLERRIKFLDIQVDCLIWRSWKIGEKLQALEKGKKSRITIFAIIYLWTQLLHIMRTKDFLGEAFWFCLVVGMGRIMVGVYELFRD